MRDGISQRSVVIGGRLTGMQRSTLSRLAEWISIRRGRIILHLILFTALLIFLLPIIWTISASFKGRMELFQTLPSLFPHRPTLDNYVYVWTRVKHFPTYFANSVVVTGIAVTLTVLLSSLAGYAFGRLRFKGRDLIYYSLVLQVFIPRAGGLMALYEVMQFFGLRNSLPGLALVFVGNVGVPIFIMRQTFFNLPSEFEDAAQIDGCNRWQTFWRVMAPMATSGMILVAIFSFIHVWGEFLVTLTMIDDQEKFTLALGIANLNLWTTSWQVDVEVLPYGTQAAGYLLAALPTLLVFVTLQKWFVRGMSEGLKF
ncbi:MAG: carbohydrate ABC transporter permease [Chloroflexi bacterium]|nr:carbohydrate ABC transporter permease [Chloroflexota bacterium]